MAKGIVKLAKDTVDIWREGLSPWAQRRVWLAGRKDPSLRSGWQPGYRSSPLTGSLLSKCL